MARTWLRNQRERLNLSEKEVAKQMSISQDYYKKIEAGEAQRKMDPLVVGMLSAILNVSPVVIMEQEAL